MLLDCVRRPRFQKKTKKSGRFGDWFCPRPQVYKIMGGGGKVKR
jgi:hypothetical protein